MRIAGQSLTGANEITSIDFFWDDGPSKPVLALPLASLSASLLYLHLLFPISGFLIVSEEMGLGQTHTIEGREKGRDFLSVSEASMKYPFKASQSGDVLESCVEYKVETFISPAVLGAFTHLSSASSSLLFNMCHHHLCMCVCVFPHYAI